MFCQKDRPVLADLLCDAHPGMKDPPVHKPIIANSAIYYPDPNGFIRPTPDKDGKYLYSRFSFASRVFSELVLKDGAVCLSDNPGIANPDRDIPIIPVELPIRPNLRTDQIVILPSTYLGFSLDFVNNLWTTLVTGLSRIQLYCQMPKDFHKRVCRLMLPPILPDSSILVAIDFPSGRQEWNLPSNAAGFAESLQSSSQRTVTVISRPYTSRVETLYPLHQIQPHLAELHEAMILYDQLVHLGVNADTSACISSCVITGPTDFDLYKKNLTAADFNLCLPDFSLQHDLLLPLPGEPVMHKFFDPGQVVPSTNPYPEFLKDMSLETKIAASNLKLNFKYLEEYFSIIQSQSTTIPVTISRTAITATLMFITLEAFDMSPSIQVNLIEVVRAIGLQYRAFYSKWNPKDCFWVHLNKQIAAARPSGVLVSMSPGSDALDLMSHVKYTPFQMKFLTCTDKTYIEKCRHVRVLTTNECPICWYNMLHRAKAGVESKAHNISINDEIADIFNLEDDDSLLQAKVLYLLALHKHLAPLVTNRLAQAVVANKLDILQRNFFRCKAYRPSLQYKLPNDEWWETTQAETEYKTFIPKQNMDFLTLEERATLPLLQSASTVPHKEDTIFVDILFFAEVAKALQDVPDIMDGHIFQFLSDQSKGAKLPMWMYVTDLVPAMFSSGVSPQNIAKIILVARKISTCVPRTRTDNYVNFQADEKIHKAYVTILEVMSSLLEDPDDIVAMSTAWIPLLGGVDFSGTGINVWDQDYSTADASGFFGPLKDLMQGLIASLKSVLNNVISCEILKTADAISPFISVVSGIYALIRMVCTHGTPLDVKLSVAVATGFSIYSAIRHLTVFGKIAALNEGAEVGFNSVVEALQAAVGLAEDEQLLFEGIEAEAHANGVPKAAVRIGLVSLTAIGSAFGLKTPMLLKDLGVSLRYAETTVDATLEILSDVFGLDCDGTKKLNALIIELEQKGQLYLNLPTSAWIGGKIKEIEEWLRLSGDATRKIMKPGQPSSVRLMNVTTEVSKRLSQYYLGKMSSASRPVPYCAWFYSEPGIGKTEYVNNCLVPSLAARFGVEADIYNLDSGKYFAAYKNERFAIIDEAGSRVGANAEGNPLILLNQILSSSPIILQGAGIEDKQQCPAMSAVFIISNFKPKEVDFGVANETKVAMLSRMDVFQVCDDKYIEANGRTNQPHRRADYSHLKFKLISEHLIQEVDKATTHLRDRDRNFYFDRKDVLIRAETKITASVKRWQQIVDTKKTVIDVGRKTDNNGQPITLPGVMELMEATAHADENPYVITVAGKPGIGKTRVIVPELTAFGLAMGYDIHKLTRLQVPMGPGPRRMYIIDDLIDFSEKKHQEAFLKFINLCDAKDVVVNVTNWGPTTPITSIAFWKLWTSYPYQSFDVKIPGIARRLGLSGDNRQALFLICHLDRTLTTLDNTICTIPSAIFALTQNLNQKVYPKIHTTIPEVIPFSSNDCDMWLCHTDISKFGINDLLRGRPSLRLTRFLMPVFTRLRDDPDWFNKTMAELQAGLPQLPDLKVYISVPGKTFLVFGGDIYLGANCTKYTILKEDKEFVYVDDFRLKTRVKITPNVYCSALLKKVPVLQDMTEAIAYDAVVHFLSIEDEEFHSEISKRPAYIRDNQQLQESLIAIRQSRLVGWKEMAAGAIGAAAIMGGLVIAYNAICRLAQSFTQSPAETKNAKVPVFCKLCTKGLYCPEDKYDVSSEDEEEFERAEKKKGKNKGGGRGAIKTGQRLSAGRSWYFRGILYYDDDDDHCSESSEARHELKRLLRSGKQYVSGSNYCVDIMMGSGVTMIGVRSMTGGRWYIDDVTYSHNSLPEILEKVPQCVFRGERATDGSFFRMTALNKTMLIAPAHCLGEVGDLINVRGYKPCTFKSYARVVKLDKQRELGFCITTDVRGKPVPLPIPFEFSKTLLDLDDIEFQPSGNIIVPSDDSTLFYCNKMFIERQRVGLWGIADFKNWDINIGNVLWLSQDVPSLPGYCGSPVVVVVDEKPILIGVHAGSRRKGAIRSCIFSTICREAFNDCIDPPEEVLVHASLPQYDPVEIETHPDAQFGSDFTLLVPGRFGKLIRKSNFNDYSVCNRAKNYGVVTNYSPMDTKLERLRIFCRPLEEVFGVLKQPTLSMWEIEEEYSDLLPLDAKGQKRAVALKMNRLCLTPDMQPSDIEMLRIAMARLGTYLRLEHGNKKLRPLSILESLNGLSPESKMDLKASLGAHANLMFPGCQKKSNVLEIVDGKVIFKDTPAGKFYLDFTDDQWEYAGKGKMLAMPATASFKSELLELDKEHKKRVVNVEDLASVINQKRILLPVQELLCSTGPKSRFILKSNPKVDWHIIAQHLMENGNMLSLDFKDFDWSLPGPVIAAAAEFVIALYGISDVDNPKLTTRIRTFMKGIAYKLILVQEDLILKSDGMVSGMFGTSLVDSICVLGILYVVYSKTLFQDGELAYVEDFMNDVISKHNGDDNTLAINHEATHHFDFANIKRIVKQSFGMDITGSGKDDSDEPFTGIQEASFCSRSFVTLEGFPSTFYPKLKESSLSGIVNYSAYEMPADIAVQLMSARSDVIAYGRSKFEQFEAAIHSYMEEHRLPYEPVTFDSLVKEAWNAIHMVAPPGNYSIIELMLKNNSQSKSDPVPSRAIEYKVQLPTKTSDLLKLAEDFSTEDPMDSRSDKVKLALLKETAKENSDQRDWVKIPIVSRIATANGGHMNFITVKVPVTTEIYQTPLTSNLFFWADLAKCCKDGKANTTIIESLEILEKIDFAKIPAGSRKSALTKNYSMLKMIASVASGDPSEWPVLVKTLTTSSISETGGNPGESVPAVAAGPTLKDTSTTSGPLMMMPTAGLMESLALNTGYFMEMTDYLNIPYVTGQIPISTSTAAGTLLQTFDFNPWDPKIVGPYVSTYAAAHKSFSGQIELKFNITSTSTAFGSLTLIQVPGPYIPDGPPTIQSLEKFMYVDVDLSSPQTFSMIMKAATTSEFLVTKKAIDDGKVYSRIYMFARTPIQNSFQNALQIPLIIHSCITPGSKFNDPVIFGGNTVVMSAPPLPVYNTIMVVDSIYPDPAVVKPQLITFGHAADPFRHKQIAYFSSLNEKDGLKLNVVCAANARSTNEGGMQPKRLSAGHIDYRAGDVYFELNTGEPWTGFSFMEITGTMACSYGEELNTEYGPVTIDNVMHVQPKVSSSPDQVEHLCYVRFKTAKTHTLPSDFPDACIVPHAVVIITMDNPVVTKGIQTDRSAIPFGFSRVFLTSKTTSVPAVNTGVTGIAMVIEDNQYSFEEEVKRVLAQQREGSIIYTVTSPGGLQQVQFVANKYGLWCLSDPYVVIQLNTVGLQIDHAYSSTEWPGITPVPKAIVLSRRPATAAAPPVLTWKSRLEELSEFYRTVDSNSESGPLDVPDGFVPVSMDIDVPNASIFNQQQYELAVQHMLQGTRFNGFILTMVTEDGQSIETVTNRLGTFAKSDPDKRIIIPKAIPFRTTFKTETMWPNINPVPQELQEPQGWDMRRKVLKMFCCSAQVNQESWVAPLITGIGAAAASAGDMIFRTQQNEADRDIVRMQTNKAMENANAQRDLQKYGIDMGNALGKQQMENSTKNLLIQNANQFRLQQNDQTFQIQRALLNTGNWSIKAIRDLGSTRTGFGNLDPTDTSSLFKGPSAGLGSQTFVKGETLNPTTQAEIHQPQTHVAQDLTTDQLGKAFAGSFFTGAAPPTEGISAAPEEKVASSNVDAPVLHVDNPTEIRRQKETPYKGATLTDSDFGFNEVDDDDMGLITGQSVKRFDAIRPMTFHSRLRAEARRGASAKYFRLYKHDDTTTEV